MEIIVKKSREERVPGTRKMSVAERANISGQAKERESDLRAQGARATNERFYSAPIQSDRGDIERETKVLNTKLQADDELISKGKQKDRDEAEAKSLRDELRGKIPPHHLQQAKPGTSEYQKAVYAGERALAPEVTKKFERYQSLRRGVEPENPHAGSVSEIID